MAVDEPFPVGARVRCADPNHRDHQHHQGVGVVLGHKDYFTLEGTPRTLCEVVWANVQSTQKHDATTLHRSYTRAELVEMRRELERELDNLRQDLS